MPITVFVGAAVETARLTNTKAHMQSAIDAATLAAANGSESPEAVFVANLQDSSASQARSSFKKNADGSVSGTASAFVSTPLMKLFTDSGVAVATKAKAGKVYVEMPQTTSLSLSGAAGWYWKKIDLYLHKKGDATDTLMASYIYQPIDLIANGRIGTGTTTASFNVNGAMVGNAISTPGLSGILCVGPG